MCRDIQFHFSGKSENRSVVLLGCVYAMMQFNEHWNKIQSPNTPLNKHVRKTDQKFRFLVVLDVINEVVGDAIDIGV